jgi:hypothetical protein
VLSIQHLHGRIVHEEHAELGPFEPEGAEHARRERADAFSGEARSPLSAAGNQSRHGARVYPLGVGGREEQWDRLPRFPKAEAAFRVHRSGWLAPRARPVST